MQFLLALGGTTAVQKGPLWWAGHHRLHHQSARARIDDAERAQRQQRKCLYLRACRPGIIRGTGCERPDQPLDQRPDQRGRRERGILVGKMAASECGTDARFERTRERTAVGHPRGVDLRLDRLRD